MQSLHQIPEISPYLAIKQVAELPFGFPGDRRKHRCAVELEGLMPEEQMRQFVQLDVALVYFRYVVAVENILPGFVAVRNPQAAQVGRLVPRGAATLPRSTPFFNPSPAAHRSHARTGRLLCPK